MFQTKNFPSIVASMINHMRVTQDRITDFHVGGVARTLVEAPAIELDEFYQRVLYGLLEAIPTAIYHAFGFDALPAAHAGGTVRFSAQATVATAVPIPAGTVVVSPATSRRYMTDADSEIPSGSSYADVRVTAEYAGIDGNAPSGTLTELSSQVDQVVSITNPDPIIGGKEAEADEERKERFIYYIGSLSRGTVWAINYAAKSATVLSGSGDIAEYVERVGIDEGAGRVTLYLLGSHGEASDELIAEAQSIIDGRPPTATELDWVAGYRPAGVEVNAAKMAIRPVSVVLRVAFISNLYVVDAGLIAAVRTVLNAKLSAAMPGTIIYANELIDAVLSLTPMLRVILDSDSNVVCGVNEQLILGDLSITEIAA